MKIKSRAAAVLAAILLAAALTASAVSGSVLNQVYTAGKTLLFDTDNVTLNGTAQFSLDGERFKTVKARYIQDDHDSRWDYHLSTPRRGRTADQETGYTVRAHDWEIAVVEEYYPGTYRTGITDAQNTLVTRSMLMDQAVDLAGIALAYLEPTLGDAVEVVTANHAGTTVHVKLDESNITDLTRAAFSLCAHMAVHRAIAPGGLDASERSLAGIEAYKNSFSVARGILDCTEAYLLRSADVTATLDGNGRLRAFSGSAAVDLREVEDSQVLPGEPDPHRLDFTFDITVSNYGTSKLEPFAPEAEGLVLENRIGY